MIECLKPYSGSDAMKQSARTSEVNIPWLTAIPAHWKVIRSKRLFTARKEKAQPDDVQLSATQAYGVIPQKEFESREGRRVVRITQHLEKRAHVERDDFVISMRSFQGGLERAWARGCIRSSYVVLKPSQEAHVGYFAHLFKSQDYIRALQATSNFIRDGQDLNLANFALVDLPLPPPDEQAAIANLLDYANGRLERAVRAKRKVIALLHEQKQAIIHRAVTRGLDPTVPLKPSGIPWLGEVPKHWEVLPLGRVLVERKENNHPIKTKSILSLSLHDGVVPYAERTRPGGNRAKEDLTAYKLAYPGDIVVNSMNVVVGSVGLSQYFGAVSPVYYMLRPRQSADIVEYFDSLFHDVAFQRSLFGLGNGIMVIQSKSSGKLNTIRMRIPMGKLNRVEIPYPPPSEQMAIVAGIGAETAPVNTAIARLEREIELLREYRTRLVADVVTGKLDVRPAARHLPAEPLAPEPEPEESPEPEEGGPKE